jgi:hypothetical protein
MGIHDADLHHASIVYEWSSEPTEVTEAPDLKNGATEPTERTKKNR